MSPRLKQPLFLESLYGVWEERFGADQIPTKDALYLHVLAYDVIWTLINSPEDISKWNQIGNASALLQMLGHRIEQKLGEDVFLMPPLPPPRPPERDPDGPAL